MLGRQPLNYYICAIIAASIVLQVLRPVFFYLNEFTPCRVNFDTWGTLEPGGT
jgi:hypothetical protein